MEIAMSLYERMMEQLTEVELENDNIIQRAQCSYRIVEAAMRELKKQVCAYEFATEEEEVTFFKEIKPKFYSRLIYFIRLLQIESHVPVGSAKSKKRYLRKKLNIIHRFFEENDHFYQYYRTGSSHLDKQYFIRNNFNLPLDVDLSYFDCDPCFTTSHDYKVAMVIANEELCVYINAALSQLSGKPVSAILPHIGGLKLNWSETKAALIELLYALHSSNVFSCFNTNGPVELKQVATFMEMSLGISLGNYSRTFQEIRIRKKGRTAFLDRIRDQLIQRMDAADE